MSKKSKKKKIEKRKQKIMKEMDKTITYVMIIEGIVVFLLGYLMCVNNW